LNCQCSERSSLPPSGLAAAAAADAIQDAFRFFAQRGAAALAIPEFVPTPDNLRFTGAVARLDKAVFALIAERRRWVLEGCVLPLGQGGAGLAWGWGRV
jgi:hypothetical protein